MTRHPGPWLHSWLGSTMCPSDPCTHVFFQEKGLGARKVDPFPLNSCFPRQQKLGAPRSCNHFFPGPCAGLCCPLQGINGDGVGEGSPPPWLPPSHTPKRRLCSTSVAPRQVWGFGTAEDSTYNILKTCSILPGGFGFFYFSKQQMKYKMGILGSTNSPRVQGSMRYPVSAIKGMSDDLVTLLSPLRWSALWL